MLRTMTAVAAGKAAMLAARVRGGGSALPGLIVERIDPSFLATSLSRVRGGIVVVSGTNGKTTTTKMLAEVLRAHDKEVFSNPTGSNFTRGVISSLLGKVGVDGRIQADFAVVELDEAHSIPFAQAVAPTHALLLNVARDQLDRFAEIDHTAELLARLASYTTTGFVLNRDDSFISRIAGRLEEAPRSQRPVPPRIGYFGVHPDIADRLPELLEADLRSDEETNLPDLGAGDGLLRPIDENSFEILFGDGTAVGPLKLRQRGLAAMINATAATTMARQLLGTEFDVAAAERALRNVAPPFGRGEVVDVDGQPLELVLVKNPAGFTVALGTYGSSPVATMIAINDDYADGRDVSWLYDVSFDSLAERGVAITSGVRAYDMAVRLHYDDITTYAQETDLEKALEQFLETYPNEPKRIFCTYTAMMALRRMLAARYGLAAIGEDTPGKSERLS
nr:Mur ligase family protein [Austwickia chelonae]